MNRRALLVGLSVAAAAVIGFAVWRAGDDAPCAADPCPSRAPASFPAPTGPDRVITAAGDIADPDPTDATRATAELVTVIDPNVALTLGDNQYPEGELSDYTSGYGSSWGAFLDRTRPAIGNHEYGSSPTADGYFAYFGARSPGNYYSFELGAWHLISLDSNCDQVGGCTPGTAQYEWLRADLAANDAACTLAYWHHPRWSSGTEHGNSEQVAPFVDLLYDDGADVILSGHEHNYERYAPQDPEGSLDADRGIVQFVVGTGGHSLYELGPPDENSLVQDDSTYGVLRMILRPGSYDFSFEPVLDGTFTDSGSGRCH